VVGDPGSDPGSGVGPAGGGAAANARLVRDTNNNYCARGCVRGRVGGLGGGKQDVSACMNTREGAWLLLCPDCSSLCVLVTRSPPKARLRYQ